MATEAAEDAAREKARFCLRTGVQPSEYDAMTETEVAAFVEEHNELHAT